MTITSRADIAGADAKVAISTTPGAQARSLWLTATGSSNARFGDTNITSARGIALTANVQSTFNANAGDPTDVIDLTTSYVYVPTGTTISVSWGV